MSSDIPEARGRIAIAIVDDDASLRVSLRRLCAVLGYDATAYPSGRMFLETLDSNGARPNCLLVDLQMPEMTGLELHRALINRGVRIPTIIITGDDAPEVCARCMQSGVTACLQKPIGANELVAIVEKVTQQLPPIST